MAILLSPLHIHGRDSTLPEAVDAGVGDQGANCLLDNVQLP